MLALPAEALPNAVLPSTLERGSHHSGQLRMQQPQAHLASLETIRGQLAVAQNSVEEIADYPCRSVLFCPFQGTTCIAGIFCSVAWEPRRTSGANPSAKAAAHLAG